MSRLSPGHIVTGLSMSALCPPIGIFLVCELWVFHAPQSLLHPDTECPDMHATCKHCIFQSYFVSVEQVANDPNKDVLPPSLHPTLCAQWHPETWWRISGRWRNYPTKDQWFPLNTHGIHFKLYNIYTGEQKFHRTILTWGGLHHPPSGAWKFPDTSLRDAKSGELISLHSPPLPCPEAINLTIHL